MVKRVALALPILENPIERILFQQNAHTHVLLVLAVRLEQPCVGFLPLRRRLLLDLRQGSIRVIE